MAMTPKQAAAAQSEYESAHAAMDAQEATHVAGLSDRVKAGARALGRSILGAGTERDATAEAHEYRLYRREAEDNSETPMSREDFIKSRAKS